MIIIIIIIIMIIIVINIAITITTITITITIIILMITIIIIIIITIMIIIKKICYHINKNPRRDAMIGRCTDIQINKSELRRGPAMRGRIEESVRRQKTWKTCRG